MDSIAWQCYCFALSYRIKHHKAMGGINRDTPVKFIEGVQKLQFPTTTKKQQNVGYFARLVREPTGFLNKPII
jgi:hypothetical protein